MNGYVKRVDEVLFCSLTFCYTQLNYVKWNFKRAVRRCKGVKKYRECLKSYDIRILSVKEWQETWETSEKGRWMFRGLPTVQCTLIPTSPMVNRLIICHFPTAAYLYRFRRREDPSCPECGEEETVDHLLLDCDATADLETSTESGASRTHSSVIPTWRMWPLED